MIGSSATSAREAPSAELWRTATTGQTCGAVAVKVHLTTVALATSAGQVSVKNRTETETVEASPSSSRTTLTVWVPVVVPSSAATVRVTVVVPTASGTAALCWPLSTSMLVAPLPSRSRLLPPNDALMVMVASPWAASAVSVASVTP